jgi:predicted phosphodiesterase
MKLGLLADIHESNEFLRIALGQFRTEEVDQVVVLGDLIELGE